MGCAASSGAAPNDAWVATGALGTGAVVAAPALSRTGPQGAVREPQPEPEPEPRSLQAQIALADLEELCILGVGSFGVVTLVRHRPDGKTYGETHRAPRTLV